jgi:hypothetical protein
VSGPNRRRVILVDDAVIKLATLDAAEQSLVQAEIARMSNPDFRPESDQRGHRRGGGGRAYYVHTVPKSNLRLWYRQLDKRNPTDPETLAVMVIDRKGDPA